MSRWLLFHLLFLLQVAKLFQKIQEMVEEESNLVFVLIGQHLFFLYVLTFCLHLHKMYEVY